MSTTPVRSRAVGFTRPSATAGWPFGLGGALLASVAGLSPENGFSASPLRRPRRSVAFLVGARRAARLRPRERASALAGATRASSSAASN